jgi:Sulfotransferase family
VRTLGTAAVGRATKQLARVLLDRVPGERLRLFAYGTREYGRLRDARLHHLVEVSQPLVLISQIQRSGGTLLSQLFDGHPQCHAHAYELYIGHPHKSVWPSLNLQDPPEVWYGILSEAPARDAFLEGYRKAAQGATEALRAGELPTFPFLLPPRLQESLFLRLVRARPIRSERQILDCYMTSYFNAWLDNQNLYSGPKRYVTAFVPRMIMNEENVAAFFRIYPDGFLISIIRDPRSWFVSARKHRPAVFGQMEKATSLWKESVHAGLKARRRYGRRVAIVAFEDLVGATEPTMRRLAQYLDIEFSPGLLDPTFNGMPIQADSSYKVDTYGVIRDPLERHSALLSPQEMGYITREALPLYEGTVQTEVTVRAAG